MFSCDRNGKILAVNCKIGQSLTFSRKAINTWRPSSKGHQYLSDEGLALETSAFKLFTVANLRFQLG